MSNGLAFILFALLMLFLCYADGQCSEDYKDNW